MSAHSQLKQMLDQLMGSAGAPVEESTETDYNSPSVCKAYLLSCCPHDVLTGTRLELGPCSLIHSMALRTDYEKQSQKDKRDKSIIRQALTTVEKFLKEQDRRTQNAKKKLEQNVGRDVIELGERVQKLDELIKVGLGEVEELGATGQVEESLQKMSEIETLTTQKTELEQEYKQKLTPATIQQQKLRVCDVCSSYLGINDNDRRLADHFGGKLHLGFLKLRESFDELKKIVGETNDRHSYSSDRNSSSSRSHGDHHNNEMKSGSSPSSSSSSREHQQHQRDSRQDRSSNHGYHHHHRDSGHYSRSSSRDYHHQQQQHNRNNRDYRNNDSNNHHRNRKRSRSPL